MEARVPWKEGYYGPAISRALGFGPEEMSPLRREGDWLVCPGVTTEELAKVCASIDHAAARAEASKQPPSELEQLQARVAELEAKVK